MTSPTKPIVYVVERLEWRGTCRGGSWEPEWEGWVQLPGAKRLRSFATLEEADRFCAECEETVRARANPFACGGPALHYQSSFDADRLHDWLVDADITPPRRKKDGSRDWRGWWEKSAGQLTQEQRNHIWKALDKVRFHRVVERPRRATVYLVVRREWQYNDEWYYVVAEGGQALEAYSTWEKAEQARARREEESIGEYGQNESYYAQHEVTELAWARAEPFMPLPREDIFAQPGEPLFFDVLEVEMEE
jgi:hypothetical protein